MNFRRYGVLVSFALGFASILSVANLSFPTLGEVIMAEDKFIENASAAAFFLAGAISAMAMVRGTRGLAVLLFVLGTAAFLSEISFGERIFEFEPPIINGVKIDAIHDLFQLSWIFVSNGILYVVLIVFLSIIAIFASLYIFLKSEKFRILVRHPAVPSIATSLTMIAIGLVLDFDLGKVILRTIGGETAISIVSNSYFEESSEFVGSLFFLYATIKLIIARPVHRVLDEDLGSAALCHPEQIHRSDRIKRNRFSNDPN